MTDKPNNFPREGQHNPVTRDAVDRIAATRPTLNVARHYTIEGEVEVAVHSNLNAEREAAITTGERRLATASQALRQGFQKPGNDARSDYVRQQKALAEHWQERRRGKAPTPTR